MTSLALPLMLLAQGLGTTAQNQPIYAGTLVFGVTGLVLFYLSFVNDEMEAGVVLKGMSIGLIALTLLATFWPMRPWPH